MWNIGFLLILTILIIIIHPQNPKLREDKQRVVKIDPENSNFVGGILLLLPSNIEIVEKISSKIGEDHNIW